MRELEVLVGLVLAAVALAALARCHAVLAMRASHEIGDDAFHQMEEELDWIEMAGGGNEGADLEARS